MKFNIQLKSSKIVSNKAAGGIIKFIPDGDSFSKDSIKFLNEIGLVFDQKKFSRFFIKDKNSIRLTPESGNYDFVQILKVKVDQKFNSDFFRDACSQLIKSVEPNSVEYIDVEIPSYNSFSSYFNSEDYYLQTFAEGILLGNYNFDIYKSSKSKPSKLTVNLVGDNIKLINKNIKEAELLIESVYFARDLSNEPAITVTPQELASRSRKELTKLGVSVTIFNKQELKKRKMTAILAVGDASAHPPLMMVMRYKPKVKAKKKIALVGKGVTYDSGGLSIKPSDAMLEMKGDMAGAATVIGTIYAAAKAKLPIELIGVVPAVENMLSGNSYKPGDIVMASNGKSIEVGNTDAEGRVILADALHYASKEKPDEIIDFATLTGACLVAIGDFVAGLFTNYDTLAEKLSNSGNRTHERVWRLPLWHEYGKLIESDIADVKNVGPRWGGAITAAKFLEHFVDENIPWAHIDLAGPSLKHKATSYTEDFNTGFGIRLTYDYLLQL